MLLYLLVFVLGAAAPSLIPLVLRRRSSPEVYDDADAVLLNLERGKSMWFNMGWWSEGGKESFPEAAAEHCCRVARAAGLKRDQRVLEVGYGSGDSTLQLSREFSPKSYVGFTSLPAQHALAEKRAVEAGLLAPQYRLLCGDAAKALLTLPPSSVDAVLAVDCAYHFAPRSAFLRSAHALLVPAGTLALSDLLLPTTPLTLLDSLLLRLLCFFAGLPFSNLHTPSTYRVQLVALGFDADDITMEDISERVWPGFLEFVERRERELGGGRGVLGKGWDGMKKYASVVRWYSGAGGGRVKLRYYLISAKKREESSSTLSGGTEKVE